LHFTAQAANEQHSKMLFFSAHNADCYVFIPLEREAKAKEEREPIRERARGNRKRVCNERPLLLRVVCVFKCSLSRATTTTTAMNERV
jgi:hypothetical protein